MKESFKGDILAAIHPDSVRVRLIAKDIIEALQRGLSHEVTWTDVDCASGKVEPPHEGGNKDTLMALQDAPQEGKWSREDEFLITDASSEKMDENGSGLHGLLLVACAGCDSRVCPTVYEKLSKVTGGDSALRDCLSTHQSGKTRAELLAQAKIMEEALAIYQDVRAGRGVEGFL